MMQTKSGRCIGVATVAAFALTLAFSSAAAADPKGHSLQDKRDWALADTRLAKKSRAVRRACGFPIRAAYSARSYRERPLPSHTRNHCENALYIVQLLCGQSVGRQVVQRKVRAVSCRMSRRGTFASLQGRTIVVHIDPSTNHIHGRKKGNYNWKSAVEELL